MWIRLFRDICVEKLTERLPSFLGIEFEDVSIVFFEDSPQIRVVSFEAISESRYIGPCSIARPDVKCCSQDRNVMADMSLGAPKVSIAMRK